MSKSIWIVEHKYSTDEDFTPCADFPSGQLKAFPTRKEAADCRKSMIFNTPYLSVRQSRVRKFVPEGNR